MDNENIKEILDYLNIKGKKMIGIKQKELLLDYITNLQEEIERLNNITEELEKWLRDEYSKYNGAIRIVNVLDKLKELKEGK